MDKKKQVVKHSQSLIPAEVIERRILFIRGTKVMLDSSLAQLFEVPTKSLNLAVKRNLARFPEDFMFSHRNFKKLKFRFPAVFLRKQSAGDKIGTNSDVTPVPVLPVCRQTGKTTGPEGKIVHEPACRTGRRKRVPILRLTGKEVDLLRFQFETSKDGRGGRRYFPFVFTQEGVAMLSGVLNSPRAIAVNIEIMRVFVRLRQILATHKDLAVKLTELEKKYDDQFEEVFEAIRGLMREEEKPKAPMGFHPSP